MAGGHRSGRPLHTVRPDNGLSSTAWWENGIRIELLQKGERSYERKYSPVRHIQSAANQGRVPYVSTQGGATNKPLFSPHATRDTFKYLSLFMVNISNFKTLNRSNISFDNVTSVASASLKRPVHFPINHPSLWWW